MMGRIENEKKIEGSVGSYYIRCIDGIDIYYNIENELSQLLRFIIVKFMFGIKDLFAVTRILAAFLLFVFII